MFPSIFISLNFQIQRVLTIYTMVNVYIIQIMILVAVLKTEKKLLSPFNISFVSTIATTNIYMYKYMYKCYCFILIFVILIFMFAFLCEFTWGYSNRFSSEKKTLIQVTECQTENCDLKLMLKKKKDNFQSKFS